MPLRRLALCLTSSLFTLMTAVGCSLDSTRSVSHPIVQPPDIPGPVPTFAISGVVFEHTASARRPAAGIALAVFSEEAVFATTDANGRYTAFVRGDVVSIAPSETAAFMSPCPSGTSSLSFTGTRAFDVHVVSRAELSTTGVPSSYPITSIFASGTVVERTPVGSRPVTGALVTLGSGIVGSSRTLSDTLGRYVLCTAPPGVGTDQLISLQVAKDGYFPTSLYVLGGWDERGVTVELARRQ